MSVATYEFQKSVPIASEQIEPFAAMIVGRLWARCEAAKNEPKYPEQALEYACRYFWFGLQGLEKIAIATSTATHFSIAMNNEFQRAARYIEHETGHNPIHEKW